MTTIANEKQTIIRRIYAWVLSFWSILVGVLFVVQVWRIFSLGAKSFTTDTIAKYFSQISVFVWLWIALVVGSIVLNTLSPNEKEKLTAVIEPKYTLLKLRRRLPATTGMNPLKKQSLSRVVVWSVCACTCLACFIVALVYMLGDYTPRATSGFFSAHEEAERFVRALPWVLASLLVWIASASFDKYSILKETKLVKEQIAQNAKQGIKGELAEEKPTFIQKLYAKLPFIKSKWFLRGVRIFVAVLGLGLIVYDIAFLDGGGMADMLEKAVNICTQCIGLG